MKKCLSLVLLMLIAACADPSAHPLDGDYVLVLETEPCSIALTFSGDDYVYQYGCELEDGTIGIETEVGTFELKGDTVRFSPERSTCAVDDGTPFEYRLRRDKDGITLLDDEVIVRLERVDITPQNMTQLAVFGCYDDEGRFTTMPLTTTN